MADQNLQRLIVSLEARVDKYEKSLARAQNVTRTQFRAMTKEAKQFNGTLATVGAGARQFGRVMGAIGVGVSLRGFQALADASTRVTNALKIAGLEGAALQSTYDALFASAQRNAAPLEALVELYGRASQVQKELGASSEDLLNFTDKVAVALRVSGKSATESSGALLQLSQALGGGVVRAEEFNSILEGALPIAQAAAAGLDEAGGSVAKLRQLVVDGKVSSEAFFRAFEAGAVVLVEKVANAEETVSQRFTRLQNVMVDAAGKFDDATGASDLLGAGLDGLAGFVDKVGNAFAANKDSIGEFFAEIRKGLAETSQFAQGKRNPSTGEVTFFEPVDFDALARWVAGFFQERQAVPVTVPGADLPIPAVGDWNGLPVPGGAPVISSTSARTPARPTDPNLQIFRDADYGSMAGVGGTSASTVSLADYPIVGARDAATKATEKEREAVRQLIADLEFEKSLVGESALEIEIQNAIRAAGATATEDQKAAIRTLLTEIDAERLALEATTEAMQEFADLSRAALGQFVDDLLAGKSATESLGNALSMIGKSFLNKGLDLLVGAIFPGFAEGGYVDSYAKGGFTGPGGKFAPAGVVHAGEYVFDADSVRRIGVNNLERIRGYADGGFVGRASAFDGGSANDNRTQITYAPTVTVSGGASRRDIEMVMRQAKREFRDELPSMLAEARKRGSM